MVKHIHPLSDVQSENIGDNTFVWQFSVVLKGAVIGANCNINCNCFIENDVTLGNNVTVKAGVQLWDQTDIEDDVFIGPNATFVNDFIPRSKKYRSNEKRIRIRKGASIGANATIMAGVEVGEYAMIGAGGVVTKNVPPYTLWFGNQAKQTGYITSNGDILTMDLKSKATGVQYILENGVPVEKK